MASREKEESTYKRDLKKRIDLINWVLENMKHPELQICEIIESYRIQIEWSYLENKSNT